MITEFISDGRDYAVPYLCKITGHEKIVCLVVHGFSSSKQSTMTSRMLDELPSVGIGAIAFDFPAHGESKVDGEHLRIDNCLADLKSAEDKARELAPKAEIVYFASSFGAYITLIYLAGCNKTGNRAFLRSAAVNMPELMQQRMTQEQKVSLETSGEFTRDKEEYGYIRDIKLTRCFFEDLECNDVFKLWRKDCAELHMVHGEADQTVPLSDVKSFAELFSVPLHVVPDGDHQLSTPGAPEQVAKLAKEFFLRYDT